MANRPPTYWQKRFEIYERRANLNSQTHIKGLAKHYREAIRETEKDLAVFYSRLAANNDLPTIAAAKKLLSANELAEFKMSLETYTRLAKENGITGDWTKFLENASLKHRISRLEAMKIQMEHHATQLMRGQLTGLEKFTRSAYETAYYNGGFEIAKGTGIGKTLFQLDDKRINAVIHKPWAADGKNFSERVWGQHRPQLVQNLHKDLTRSLMRGEGPDKAIAAISHDFDVSLSAAARLVQTEESYFTSVAQKDVFNDLDVEQYQIIATLDSHTSDICQELDNKVFKMSEYEAGVTAPPFHVRCRTTTAPYFDDEVDATRAARDPETGKTVQVPADMNYQDWKDNYTVDPATGKTKAQERAEQKAKEEAEAKARAEAEKKAAEEAARAKAEAERKAREQAEAKAKAEAEARAKAEAEAAQRAKEAESQKFVPAKTIKEATEWTKANRGDNVKWGKIELESVNIINEEMNTLANDYPILKEMYKTVGANGRMKSCAWANGSLIEFNPAYVNKAGLEKLLDSEKNRIAKLQAALEQWEQATWYEPRKRSNTIRKIQEKLKYSRFGVNDSLENTDACLRGLVTHESGHTILIRKARQQQMLAGTRKDWRGRDIPAITLDETDAYKAVENAFNQAKKSGDIFKISEYASTELHEFFAETFTMYRFEKNKLPKYIIEMIEEVTR